jgi:hypothetical protein
MEKADLAVSANHHNTRKGEPPLGGLAQHDDTLVSCVALPGCIISAVLFTLIKGNDTTSRNHS